MRDLRGPTHYVFPRANTNLCGYFFSSLLTTQRTFQVLHLSDLHFGLKSTTKNLAYVEQHLVGEIQKLHRDGDFVQPVITGDLMNSPDDKSLAEFDAFRGRLVQHAGTPVVVVPGNHDVRKTGLLWKKLEPLADLEWSSVICNDEFKATFACFNTSIKAQLARGKIDAEQLQQVATKLTELKNLRPTRADYLRVAVIHHHPFTTSEDERATVPGLGIPEEPFMRMEGGDLLVDWCAKLDIPLILHGHKHHPRFQGREIRVGNTIRPVRAVGSGSTTGADALPLCYNILTWSPSSQKWTVTYKSSPLNGTGFTEDRLLLG